METDPEPGESTVQDEAAVEAACERMVLEVVRLLQEGKVDQAEYFLLEGEIQVSEIAKIASSKVPICVMIASQPHFLFA